jgi:hypothetical protein
MMMDDDDRGGDRRRPPGARASYGLHTSLDETRLATAIRISGSIAADGAPRHSSSSASAAAGWPLPTTSRPRGSSPRAAR